MEKKQKKITHAKGFQIELVKQMLTLATSGFGLVAALAWNNVIQDLVNNYVKKIFPGNTGILSLFLYAIIVTFLAVFVTYELSHILNRLAKFEEE